MNRVGAIGLLIALSFTMLSSCSIFRKGTRKRDVVAGDSTATVAPADTSIPTTGNNETSLGAEKKNLIAALTPLLTQQLTFNTFSGKAKMHYEGKGQKQEFTSNFRIKKDNIIWVSVTALGGIVQVARVYITPDTFKLINYLEKEVTIMPLSEAGKVLPAPVDFSTLQNLIVGNVLTNRGTPTDATDLGGLLSLQIQEGNTIQQITYNKTDSTIRSIHMISVNEGGPAGTLQYGGYEKVGNQKFSTDRAVNVINAGVQYYLDMNFKDVNLDNNLDYPFSIPKNYKRK